MFPQLLLDFLGFLETFDNSSISDEFFLLTSGRGFGERERFDGEIWDGEEGERVEDEVLSRLFLTFSSFEFRSAKITESAPFSEAEINLSSPSDDSENRVVFRFVSRGLESEFLESFLESLNKGGLEPISIAERVQGIPKESSPCRASCLQFRT